MKTYITQFVCSTPPYLFVWKSGEKHFWLWQQFWSTRSQQNFRVRKACRIFNFYFIQLDLILTLNGPKTSTEIGKLFLNLTLDGSVHTGLFKQTHTKCFSLWQVGQIESIFLLWWQVLLYTFRHISFFVVAEKPVWSNNMSLLHYIFLSLKLGYVVISAVQWE